MKAVQYKHTTTDYSLTFSCQSGMFTLPSGRKLAYVKPKAETNKFGGECIAYEGIGSTKDWERLDSYGPKFVENIVQATARDILCYAIRTLRRCSIVMHIYDELIIEANPHMSLDAVCEQMAGHHRGRRDAAPCKRLRHTVLQKRLIIIRNRAFAFSGKQRWMPFSNLLIRGTMRQTEVADYLPTALQQTMKNRFLLPVVRVFRKRFLTTCLTTDRRGVHGNSGGKSCEDHL